MTEITTKKCKTCNHTKSITEFHKHPQTRDRLSPECKSCKSIRSKRNHLKNHEREKAKRRLYSILNKGKRKIYWKQYALLNKEKITKYRKMWQRKNAERIKQNRLKRLAIPEVREKHREYHRQYREKRKTDPTYKITHAIRERVRSALIEQHLFKSEKTAILIGTDSASVRNHLLSHLKQGMTVDNYGYGKGKWHIDHIIPCDAFNLVDMKEQKLAFNYKNLRPLWHEENLSKKTTLPDLTKPEPEYLPGPYWFQMLIDGKLDISGIIPTVKPEFLEEHNKNYPVYLLKRKEELLGRQEMPLAA